MKRYNDLFNKICNYENLKLAHQNARKGKTNYSEVKQVDADPEKYIKKLHQLLVSGSFTTSKYTVFNRQCGNKRRTIYRLPYFPDRIVQHAILQIVEPLLIPTLIRDTFQSIKNRGTHDCRKRVQKAIDQATEDAYVLKFDIHKFYPSIDNTILKQIIRKKIKCKNTLVLLDNIINSAQGLPIGNYTSQILGNIYLSGLDHYAKEMLGIKHYFRYCDDIVVLSSKEYCILHKEFLFDYITQLNLSVKSDWQIFPIASRPLDFIGYVFSKQTTKLRKQTSKNFLQKINFIKRNHKRLNQKSAISSIMSYWGYVKYSNSKILWKKHIDNEIKSKTDKYFNNVNILRNKVN